MVPAALMAFHVEWHAASDGHGTRFFEESTDEQPSLDQLLNVIAALRAVPQVSARPEFVATLRERLTELPHRGSSTRRGSPKLSRRCPNLDGALKRSPSWPDS
jgi:hypothetical protein